MCLGNNDFINTTITIAGLSQYQCDYRIQNYMAESKNYVQFEVKKNKKNFSGI